MNTMQEKTFYQLAGSNIDNIAVAELFKLTNEHPYFSAAQYFLSCKLKAENHSGFLPQLQKTALFFNNPHWLHYQLLSKKEDIKILHKQYQEEEIKPLLNHVIHEEIEQQQLESIKHNEAVTEFLEEAKKQVPVAPIFPIQEMKEEIVEENITEAEPVFIQEPESVSENISKIAIEEEPVQAINDYPVEEVKKVAIEPSPIHIPTMESVREMMDNIKSHPQDILPREIDVQDEIVEVEVSPSMTSFALEAAEEENVYASNKQTIEEPLPIHEIPTEDEVVPVSSVQIEEEVKLEQSIDETIPENAIEIESIDEEAIENKVEQEPVQDIPVTELLAPIEDEAIQEIEIIAEPIQEEIIEEPLQKPIQDIFPIAEENNFIEEPSEEELKIEEGPIGLTADKITSILSHQLEEFKKPIAADAVLNIETEPYHTVDYFASQGIKVGADNGSQDKLSKQLRKFTDWLKHMKQVEVDPQDLGTDPELELAIQSIAKTSNEAREIVTETMAEVLEKQGKQDKAIQLYIKLSFLNPDKSAYFATKIQQLKGISS